MENKAGQHTPCAGDKRGLLHQAFSLCSTANGAVPKQHRVLWLPGKGQTGSQADDLLLPQFAALLGFTSSPAMKWYVSLPDRVLNCSK